MVTDGGLTGLSAVLRDGESIDVDFALCGNGEEMDRCPALVSFIRPATLMIDLSHAGL